MRYLWMHGLPPLLKVAALGSVLAVLAPLLVFLPMYDPSGPAASDTTAYGAGKLGEALAALAPAAAAGVAGLAGVWRLHAGRKHGRLLLMAAAAGLLALTVFTAATLGRYLIGPAMLLVLAALWFPWDAPASGTSAR